MGDRVEFKNIRQEYPTSDLNIVEHIHTRKTKTPTSHKNDEAFCLHTHKGSIYN